MGVMAVPAMAETFRVGALSSPGDPFDVLWHQFAEDVTNESGGALEAELFVRGEVGGEEALMLAVRRGRVEVSIFTTSGLSAIIPEMALLMAPFMFSGRDEADFVFDNFLWEPMSELVAEKGLTVLGLADEGFLSVFSVSPLKTPEDLVGYRMRARQVPSSPLFLGALKADVVGLTYPELIPALQTGLVQGAEAGIMTYASYGLAPVAPYFTLTRHAYSSGVYAANTAWLNGLDNDLRMAVHRATPKPETMRRLVRARNAADLARADADGFFVYRPTPDELEQWRRVTAPVAGRLVQQIGGRSQEIYDIIQRGKAAYAREHSNDER